MSDENLSVTRKLQLKELEMIKMFQDICRRHNLRYFAIGGTCLGAVRHGGFIPWDDDVDFTMPYEDYLKFAEIAKTELPPNYALYGHHSPRLFNVAYALKIHDTNTACFSPKFLRIRDFGAGIHIDLLVISGLPPEPERKNFLRKFECLRQLNKIMRLYNVGPGLPKLIAKRILNIILAPVKMFLPYDYFLTKMDNMLIKYPFDSSDKIIFAWRKPRYTKGWYKQIFWHEDFREAVYLPFEDTTIAVPVGYDRYLTMEYGDYMQLPPEDKRIPPNTATKIVDFDKSYTYYLDEAGAK